MKTFWKRCLAVAAWIALCGCAVSAAGKPAVKPIWPSADVSLEALQGATIEERGGTVFVQTGRCRPNSFPNVRFVYRETADLSGARAIRPATVRLMWQEKHYMIDAVAIAKITATVKRWGIIRHSAFGMNRAVSCETCRDFLKSQRRPRN